MKFTDKSIKELKIKPAVYEVSDDELPRLKVKISNVITELKSLPVLPQAGWDFGG